MRLTDQELERLKEWSKEDAKEIEELGGITYIVESLPELLSEIRAARVLVAGLKGIEKTGHGGGNWRRLIAQVLAKWEEETKV